MARPSLYVFSEWVMCKITRHQTGTHSHFEMVTSAGGWPPADILGARQPVQVTSRSHAHACPVGVMRSRGSLDSLDGRRLGALWVC